MQQLAFATALSVTILAIVAGMTASHALFNGNARDLPRGSRETNPHSFIVPPNDAVVMRITESARYDVDTALGTEEFKKLIPDSGHVVHVSESPETAPLPYTVTLFHQLKCLGIIRSAYIGLGRQEVPGILARHCMNYLRQTILCHPNTRLQPVKLEKGTATRDHETVCLDWTQVYEETERNQQAYSVSIRED